MGRANGWGVQADAGWLNPARGDAEGNAMNQPPLPEPPPKPADSTTPAVLGLPGSAPPAQRTTPARERTKRRVIVGLIIGAIIAVGAANSGNQPSSSSTRPPGNYTSTGRTVTVDQCHAENGTIVGDSCYVP